MSAEAVVTTDPPQETAPIKDVVLDAETPSTIPEDSPASPSSVVSPFRSPRKPKLNGLFRRLKENLPNAPDILGESFGDLSFSALPDLDRNLRRKKFDVIINVLKDENMKADDLQPWFLTTYANNGTLLHHIMGFRPPVELVKLVLLRYQEDFKIMHPQALTDAKNKTPMHLALAANCDREVVLAVAELSAMIKILN